MLRKAKKITICVIVILLIIIPIIYINIKNSDLKAILLGIISSIIASLIFYIFSEMVFDNKAEQVIILKNAISFIEDMGPKGILDIRLRSEFESDFWIKFSENTNQKWVISGRTLNRWLENDIKDHFKNNIIRILKGGGEINFIIYKKLDEEGEKEKEILHDFLKNEVFPNCVKRTKKKYILLDNIKFNILEVDKLPYLYNSNENEIIVAPYFMHISNSNNIMYVLKRSCKYGAQYSRDFQYVMRNADKNKWLDDYLIERNS